MRRFKDMTAWQLPEHQAVHDKNYRAWVTESARACSYYPVSTGTQIGTHPAVPFLTPVSKSVLYTPSVVSESALFTHKSTKTTGPHSAARRTVVAAVVPPLVAALVVPRALRGALVPGPATPVF